MYFPEIVCPTLLFRLWTFLDKIFSSLVNKIERMFSKLLISDTQNIYYHQEIGPLFFLCPQVYSCIWNYKGL